MGEDCHKLKAISVGLIPTCNLPPQITFPHHLQNILYFSDLHIDYKLDDARVSTNIDSVRIFISNILKEVWKNTLMKISSKTLHQSIIVVPGDVSSNYLNVKIFFEELRQITKEIPIIYVLGNHELAFQTNYDYSLASFSDDEIIAHYSKLCSELGIILLHNNILCIKDGHLLTTISEDTINNVAESSFSKTINNADYLILGSIGFSDLNPTFNQSYDSDDRTFSSLKKDLTQSSAFLRLINKVDQMYYGHDPPIIITHFPPPNWFSSLFHSKMIVLHGHTHKNIKKIEGNLIIIANCQWGYHGYPSSMGIYDFSNKQDIFKSFDDGIYQISSEQYRQFNDKMQIQSEGTAIKSIFMLKKNGYYAFFTKSSNNTLQILNGDSPRNVNKTNLGYYYNNLDQMIESINDHIKGLSTILESISNIIKTIGGTGRIHGLIVDIDDRFNHVIIDPKTGLAIPYYSDLIHERKSYPNLLQLLSDRRPDLLEKYNLLKKSNDSEIHTLFNETVSLTKTNVFSTNTELFEYSNKIIRIQYVQSHKILREWDEDYISDNTQFINNNLPTALPNPTLIPEIIDISTTDYCNPPAIVDSYVKSIIDSTVQDYYEDYIKKGPFGDYPILSAKKITIECQKRGVPYDCYGVCSLVENKLTECIDSDYSSFVDFIDLASDFINPLSVSESDIDLVFDYITGLLRCSKLYQECNKKQKTNYNNHIRCDYFLKFLFTPDQIDSFVAELHSRYPDEQQCTKLCFEKIDFFIERSHCHNNRELDDLNHYVRQRLAVTFGKRLDVDQNLREYLQDKVVLDRKDNTFKLNSLYRCFTDE